jgi:hypothetical protein
MRYYFDIIRSRGPVLDNSVRAEEITRHWYDDLTLALLDRNRMAAGVAVGDVSNVTTVA